MSYIQMFIPEDKPLIKPRFVAVEESWELLEHVFPEPGFRSYFLGHVVEKLAEELRKNQIKNYYDRQRFSHLASVPGLLSNISFARKETVGDDGRGTHGVHDQGAHSAGDTTSNEVVIIGQAKETKGGQDNEKAKSLGFTITHRLCDCCSKKLAPTDWVRVSAPETVAGEMWLCHDCAKKL